MGLTLDALHKLQDVERELVRLRGEKAEKERAVAVSQRLLKQLDDQVAAKRAETQQHQLKAQRLESEIRQREEQVAKLRQQLNTTRTTREYAAILTEINTEKADSDKIEEQALAALQAVDQSKAELQQFDEQRNALLQRIERAKQTLEQFIAQTHDSWKQLEHRKGELAQDVPGPTLTKFERVAEYHEGDAMADVQRPHPKHDEFVCGGCHMTITAETVNALMTRDELQTCINCGRILYLQQTEQKKQAE
jgi:predicted  nucleic acid-binding Zn-ribbon protein